MRFAHFRHNKLNVCAAKPREYQARESKDAENQTHSYTLRILSYPSPINLLAQCRGGCASYTSLAAPAVALLCCPYLVSVGLLLLDLATALFVRLEHLVFV